jgi:hypothetical protein
LIRKVQSEEGLAPKNERSLAKSLRSGKVG